MRIRFRAPEDELETTPTKSGAARATSPGVDVGAPEYIEERLANLKRKPSWNVYLDEYVSKVPDEDEEEARKKDEDGRKAFKYQPGFLHSIVISCLVVASWPFLYIIAPLLGWDEKWPLGCFTFWELLKHSILNIMSVFFSGVLLYWLICKEIPVWSHQSITNFEASLLEFKSLLGPCVRAFEQQDWKSLETLAIEPLIQIFFLLLAVVAIFHSHRPIGRYLSIFLLGAIYLDVPIYLKEMASRKPEVMKIDPSYALVDEEIHLAIDGKNLKSGGTFAWVAYWGCASTSPIGQCEQQFHSTFENGIVPVTFTTLDHYIPCYRDPPDPFKAQDFVCFEQIRLRVKDMESIPGLSEKMYQIATGVGDKKQKPKSNIKKNKRTKTKTTTAVSTIKSATIDSQGNAAVDA